MGQVSQLGSDDGVIAIILARGGSKRLPRKNVLAFGGRPLISWSIEAGRAASTISRVVLSSDDDEILSVAKAEGCETLKRPPELAADSSTSVSAILHALDTLGSKHAHIVLLQPTSPLRTAQDVDACVRECLENGAPACVSVRKLPDAQALTFRIDAEGQLVPAPAEATPTTTDTFALNGAVYAAEVEWLRRSGTFVAEGTRAYVMPADRSVDIDLASDFALAEFLLQRRQKD